MIYYDYKVHILGDNVNVEAYDYTRSSQYPAFELVVPIGGDPILEFYFLPDSATTERGENVIPVVIRVAMIGEMEDALLKLRHAYDRIRNG
jgi:hypothetical protein